MVAVGAQQIALGHLGVEDGFDLGERGGLGVVVPLLLLAAVRFFILGFVRGCTLWFGCFGWFVNVHNLTSGRRRNRL
ncbi:hypothetical protein N9S30_00605 [bacterium]|nr:hypothetical protein [bacterium]